MYYMYAHVHVYVLIVLELGQVCKTTFEASSAKTNKYSKFAHVFINVALIILIGYRMHPKLDYCFITSTSFVPVTVST